MVKFRRIENAKIDFNDNTFYVFSNGKLISMYFTVWTENGGKESKIIGLTAKGSTPSRLMSKNSFQKHLELLFEYNDKLYVVATYEEPILKFEKPDILKTVGSLNARKPTTRKTTRRTVRRY